MTTQDLHQIGDLIDSKLGKALKPIQETLDQHTKVLDQHTKVLDQHTKVLDQHTKVLDKHTQSFETLQQSVDANTASFADLESKIGSYKEAYQMNRDHIGRLNQRMNIVEEEVGVNPPEELLIAT